MSLFLFLKSKNIAKNCASIQGWRWVVTASQSEAPIDFAWQPTLSYEVIGRAFKNICEKSTPRTKACPLNTMHAFRLLSADRNIGRNAIWHVEKSIVIT